MLGLTRAPDLDRNGVHWFNVEHPLPIGGLHGRMVILDFWTFCCINCMHVIPTLQKLEKAFPDELVIIGVHSPKYSAEQSPKKVAHAIARLGITHPVVHDPHLSIWDEYAVRAWPTLTFIGPDGRVLGNLSGEPHGDRLIEGVGEMLREWRDDKLIRPQKTKTDPLKISPRKLRYPAKIKPVIGAKNGAVWALADSGHHQIVLYDDAGQERARIGSGKQGFADGSFEQASFNSPQGLISGDGTLYIADTNNHAIRRIDLAGGRIDTLAGLGHRGLALCVPEPASDVALSSPWDLELLGDELFFANAGSHQIGVHHLKNKTTGLLIGSSAEDIVDGTAYEAQLAQPSGLWLDRDNKILYFLDAETSALRAVTLCSEHRADTLIGAGLFDYGHRNGAFCHARLQHPLALAPCDGGLVVADTFNDALRHIDLKTRKVDDIGEDVFDWADGLEPDLCEPAGIAAAGPGRFLVVDSNHHRILEILTNEKTVRPWAG